MSLSVAALRLCTVKAIDGATTAGARVFDSAVDPRDLLGENAEPTIVIYTDTGKRKIVGRDILGSDHSVELVIELFVAKATRINHPAGEGEEAEEAFEIEYPATDAGHENRLRRLAYEIETTLGAGVGTWPSLWRRVAIAFSGMDSEWDRGADSKGSTRFNFLRLIYRIDPITNPVRGAPLEPGDFWHDFLAAAADDDELSDLAKDWRALITTPNLPAWRIAAGALGLTHGELAGIGLAPLDDHNATASDDAAPLEIAILDVPPAIEVEIEAET